MGWIGPAAGAARLSPVSHPFYTLNKPFSLQIDFLSLKRQKKKLNNHAGFSGKTFKKS